MNWFGIIWGAPDRLMWAPVLLVVLGMLLYRLRFMMSTVRSLAVSQYRSLLIRNFSGSKQYLKTVLFMIGAIFLFVALLEPQWNKKEQTVEQEGRDLFIALDVSRSMLAQDCTPNRLTCAKQKIKTLLHHLSSERVGLILFSGSTFVQCPLTADYGAFYMFLDQIDVETISSGTTAVDQAIKQAISAFDATPDRKNKLLVLFTDGEDFSSDLANVKQQVVEAGMHIFAVGVGTTQGAPIPLFDAHGKQVGHQLNNKGGVVISQLNEHMLQGLAHDSGGVYVKMAEDNSDVRTIISQVEQYEKEKFEDRKIATHEQQYPYFVAIAFICFVLEWVL